MKFFHKIKDYFSEEEDFLEDKWITLDIPLMVPYTELVNVKKALKPYAEELGWKIHSWDENDDFESELLKKTKTEDRKSVSASINVSPSERLTPDEFLEKMDKFMGLVYSIHRDLIYGGDNKKAEKNFREEMHFNYSRTEGHSPKKSDWIVKHSIGLLIMEYPLDKRLNFEKEDMEKALKIFGRTVEEDVKSVFLEEKTKKTELKKPSKKSEQEKNIQDAYRKMREELKGLFGFDI